MPAEPTIAEVRTVSEADAEAFSQLLPQLSSSAPPLGLTGLAAVAAAEGNHLFFARLDGRLVGACLLASFPAPTGVRALLEDVVVDESARGAGVGSALVAAALAAAAGAGARTVDLTSRPSREAANRLYAHCGFVRRETNVWRRELGTGAVA